MIYPVVVLGTDGSDFARAAERAAAAVALACEATLIVATIDDNSVRGEASVLRAIQVAREKGVTDVETKVLTGSAVDALVELADVRGAGLIVLGSRGLSMGASIIGSVASGVANRGRCDTLLVADRGDESVPHDYRRILIATDGSATADRAADRGVQLSERFASEVVLLFVGHPMTGELVLKDTASSFGSHFSANQRIEKGDPAEVIISAADDEDAGLIVVGNKGMTGMRGKFLGSVPKKVSEYATRDVLIVRTVTQSLGEIEPGGGGLVEESGHAVAVYRADDGTLVKLSPKCKHLGCTVGWNGADKTWDCPCHGSRYAADGKVIHGPAKKDLDPA